MTRRTSQNFTIAFISDEFDILTRPGHPVIAPPLHIAFDVGFTDGINRLVSEDADKLAPDNRRPIAWVILTPVVSLAFRDDKLDKFLCDLGERADNRCEAILHAIVGFALYLIGLVMSFFIILGLKTFSNLSAAR